MATRALQRHAFPRQSPNRKGGELLVAFALHDHRPAAAFRGLDTKEHRRSPGADRAVEHDVNTAAVGHLEDARERVLLLDVDHSVGTKGPGDLQASGVP